MFFNSWWLPPFLFFGWLVLGVAAIVVGGDGPKGASVDGAFAFLAFDDTASAEHVVYCGRAVVARLWVGASGASVTPVGSEAVGPAVIEVGEWIGLAWCLSNLVYIAYVGRG